MGNLVQELFDLENQLEKYVEVLNRRIYFNRTQQNEITAELQQGLGKLQQRIDYKIAYLNKKIVRLNKKLSQLEEKPPEQPAALDREVA